MPPLEEPPREVGGLGLISRGSASGRRGEEEEEEEDGEVCALGSSGEAGLSVEVAQGDGVGGQRSGFKG